MPDTVMRKTSSELAKEHWKKVKDAVRHSMIEGITEEHYKRFTITEYEKLIELQDMRALKQQVMSESEMQLVAGKLVFTTHDEESYPDPNLAQGCVFIENRGRPFPSDLLGKPICDIDPNISGLTFVVISKRFKTKFIHRFSAKKSLFIFEPWSSARQLAIYLSTNQYFDFFIMLTILINCVFLALDNPNEASEKVFLSIYTVEMIIKVLARGFILDTHSYLRDPWSWLDLIVILAGYTLVVLNVLIQSDLGSVNGLRTFRALRALKTISVIPGLKTIVNTLLRAFQMLFGVTTLIVFSLLVYSLVGIQLYMGILRHKCVRSVNLTGVQNYHEYYAQHSQNSTNWIESGDDFLLCGNSSGAGRCPTGYDCLPGIGDNPNFGYTNFDSIAASMLNCFQLLTLDFWENIYNKILRATGPWSILFFMVAIFMGDFYLLNLMLAIVAMSYEEEAVSAGKEKARKLLAKRSLKRDKGALASIYRIFPINKGLFGATDNQARKPKTHSSLSSAVRELRLQEKNANQSSDTDQPARPSSIRRSTHLVENTETAVTDAGQQDKAMPPMHSQEVINNEKVPRISKDSTMPGTSGLEREKILEMSQTSVAAITSSFAAHVRFIEDGDLSNPESSTSSFFKNKIPATRKFSLVRKVYDEDIENSKLNAYYVDRNCACCGKYCLCFLKWVNFQNRLYDVVSHIWFELFILVCISTNTIVMATEHDGMSKQWEDILRISNYIYTVIFTIEAIMKIIACSKMYFKNGWNIFDLLIVVASLIDLAAEKVEGLSVFRTFRLLRIFKLAQSWPTMRLLLTIIINTLGALAYLTVVLGIIIYIFAVIGMQLFKSTYKKTYPTDEVPRWNFTDFYHSFMMIFRILCGEFIEDLWNCMRRSNELCMVIYLPSLVFGNFVVLKLFLAMLLNSFASDTLRKDDAEASRFQMAWMKLKKSVCSCCCPCLKNSEFLKSSDDSQFPGANDDHESKASLSWMGLTNRMDHIESVAVNRRNNSTTNTEAAKDQIVENCFPNICYKGTSKALEPSPFMVKWLAFRKKMTVIVDNRIFESIILLSIAASSISLAFEDIYLEEKPIVELLLYYLNICFAVLFTLEMLLKWIAYGLKKYFTSSWTILDFIIVVISLAAIIAEQIGSTKLSAFRSLRTLRALRPLRAISKLQGMRIVVNALLMAIPSIFNVMLVCLVFWLIFSIMGVQFFRGKFYKCIDEHGDRLDSLVIPDKNACISQNLTWENSKINFDNVLSGYLALFQVATFEGWIEVMRDAIDTTEKDKQPIKENNIIYYAYFVIFIVFGSFFTLNLFIGVIIDNFNMLKKKYEGGYLDILLTVNQKRYYNSMKKLAMRKPQKTLKHPKNMVLKALYNVAVSVEFDVIVILLIIANAITLCLQHYNNSEKYDEMFSICSVIFTTFLIMEVIVKIGGLRWQYFCYLWNIYDVIVTVLSLVGIIIPENAYITQTVLHILRVVRIGRVFKILRPAKGIRKLIFALVISLPALINIGALLCLIIYIYAIIGMASFGHVKVSEGLDDMVNFQTFLNSFLLLFRLMTSAGWNDVLGGMLISPPHCDPNYWTSPAGKKIAIPNGECGTVWISVLFMVSYILIVFLVIINMYIAIILENFSEVHEEEKVGITGYDFDIFYSVWEKYDRRATQFIHYDKLSNLLADLKGPLRVPKPNEIMIATLTIPIYRGNKLHCIDILVALVKKIIVDIESTDAFSKAEKQISEKFNQIFPNRTKEDVISNTMERKREEVAARTIQRCWRFFRVHRNLDHVHFSALSRPVRKNLPSVASILLHTTLSNTRMRKNKNFRNTIWPSP